MNRWGIGVRVDGVDIGDVVIEGGTIEYGRTDVLEQPMPTTCELTLFTQDGYPQNPASWFEYGVGDWTSAASGFEAGHDTEDEYLGPRASIYIGAPVWVAATTDPGFSADHDTEDTYLGAEYRRFTGKVQAIEYEYERLRVFCVTDLEQWARAGLKDPDPDNPISADSDLHRAILLADLAPSPTTLHTQGTNGLTFDDMTADDFPVCLLDELQRIAAESDGIVYANRLGQVYFQTRKWTPPTEVEIPTTLVDREQLGMVTELGTILNRVTVEYTNPARNVSLSNVRGTWPLEAGGSAPPGSGKWRIDSSSTIAVGNSVTFYIHHTDTDGNVWSFANLKAGQRVTLTAAGAKWVGHVEGFTDNAGASGYLFLTIKLRQADGTISATTSTTITFDPPDQADTQRVTVDDATSIALYGPRAALYTTTLLLETHATAHAQTLLDAAAGGWQLPDLELKMNLATDAEVADIAAIDLGYQVSIAGLPAGAPVESYTGKVLGYTEYLSSDDWEIELHLAPVTTITDPVSEA